MLTLQVNREIISYFLSVMMINMHTAQTQIQMKKQKEYKRKWNKLLYRFNQLLLLIITGFVIVDFKKIQL